MSEIIEKHEKLLSVLDDPLEKEIVKEYLEILKTKLKELDVSCQGP